MHLVDAGHRVAVLAVDPSSARSGGSILGDKTRMEQLSRRAEAFIRPSPSGGTLGGVARRTREAMLVCEAAGFDVVLVETVGVGQSEVAVAGMVDLFVLLLGPGAGDELQGVKRGIVELADLIVVNKADGDLLDAARHTAADYAHALHLVRSTDDGAVDRVRTCSALLGEGIDELWDDDRARSSPPARASGELDARRAEQARAWMWSEVTDTLLDELRDDAGRPRPDRGAGSTTCAAGGSRPRPRLARCSPRFARGDRSTADLPEDRVSWLCVGFGGSDAPQDLPGLGDALPADLAGALVEHPVGPGGATGQEPQLHRSASVRCVRLHGLSMLLG